MQLFATNVEIDCKNLLTKPYKKAYDEVIRGNMTIYDIAKQAGVSASTVSRVINNKPGINAQTRKRVQKLLNENHYTPNEAARGLVMQSSKIIGILIEDLRIEHHTESAYVIEQEMTALGYTCITLSTGRRDEKKADYIRILEQRRVDGAILRGSMFETEAVKKSIKEHLPDVPVAIVNGYLDLPNVYGILIDEERGVKDCAELMFKKGKKHLVMAVDSDTPSNRNKQKGYLRAMLEQGIAKEDIPFYTAVNHRPVGSRWPGSSKENGKAYSAGPCDHGNRQHHVWRDRYTKA